MTPPTPASPLSDGLFLAVTERINLPVTDGDQLWAELPLTVQFMPFRR
jgi:PIN domain nuclease of toxin-antitoxin system